MIKVSFVCLGNICRSPTAEGIFRALIAKAGLADKIEVESAGTGNWHVGSKADARSRAEALGRGIKLEGCARQFEKADFDRLDYIVSVDKANLEVLQQFAPNSAARKKLSLLRDFDEQSPKDADVPDPYYGGEAGFRNVFDICEAACAGLLEAIRRDRFL